MDEASNARLQASLDQNEGAVWSSSPDARRSRKTAYSVQTGNRQRAGAPDRGYEAANCRLRDAARHLRFAASVGAGRGVRTCRTPVRLEQCGDLPPGEQPSSLGGFIRENSGAYSSP